VSGSDVWQYFLGDVRGSTAVAVTKGGVGVQVQWYDPYGAPRGLPAIVGTDRGYLGQYEDTATALGYLNNRYTDPTLGIFLSVDPLVATTSDPYLYAGGNPTTLSDPSGLEPCPKSGCTLTTSSDGHSGDNTARHGLTSVGRMCDINACRQTAEFSFMPAQGAGQAIVNLFIEQTGVGGPLGYRGDGRGASSIAGCEQSRACVVLNFENGAGGVQVAYSCRASGSCFDAHTLNGNVNELSVAGAPGGGFSLNLVAKHADSAFAETINCCLQIDFSLSFEPRHSERFENESGVMYRATSVGDRLTLHREKFPSVEAYAWSSTGLVDSYLFNARTSSLLPGIPTGLWPWSSSAATLHLTTDRPLPLGPVS
jgi:RHS repeat-associated protein